jgi:hypothetical protein
MRRPSAPRASTAVAVVVAIVAVLAVAFPGLGIGQTTSSHGGTPSDVYMQTNAGTCAEIVSLETVNLMQQSFTTDVETNIVAYFTGQFGSLEQLEEGRLFFWLNLPDTYLESPDQAIAGNVEPRTTATVMWSFENVPTGDVQIGVGARVEQHPVGALGSVNPAPSSDLKNCAFTVFVTPVEP